MEHRAWSKNKTIAILVLWQGFSVLMITVFGWPKEIIWLNFVLSCFLILASDAYHSLIFLIASIPFYVVLPNQPFDTLAIWRPLFVFLFMVWFARDLRLKIYDLRFCAWDRVLGYFAAVSVVVTLLFARFPWQGIKQLLFFINIYLFYIVLINAVESKKQVLGVVKTAAVSLGVIIALGYAQLISTFFANFDTFWVYWADNISRIFYGNGFAQVALYSNSWFSYTGGTELRMFSIQPDSQSFAYLAVFSIAFVLPLTLLISQKFRRWLWQGLRFAALAIMLSGTRAVWVGLLAPLFAAVWLYIKNYYRFFVKKTLLIFAILFLFFAASPLINLGMRYLRFAKFEENFIVRAKSIYDLEEVSNLGRLLIWRDSLKSFALRPWGVGLDNFLVTLEKNGNYRQASEKINERYNLPQKYITAHSLYLQVLVELGLAGFMVFVWFWLVVSKEFLAFLKQHSKSQEPTVFFVLVSALGFLWLLTAAIFDVTWFNDKVLIYFFIMLGLTGVVINRFDEIKE